MKQDRIELRASQKEREYFVEAASFTGTTLSAFIRQAAIEKSEEVLKNRDTLTLTDRDRDLFLSVLENPPKPNKHLEQAFEKYRKITSTILAPVKKQKVSRRAGKRSTCR